jgi:prephenate dehydrogenase
VRIGIVGLGLIGGSLAGALRAAGHEVIGCDRNLYSEETASARGLVDEVRPLADVADGADVVFLCLPVEATIDAIAEVSSLMNPDGILTDVASVKRPIIEAMNGIRARCRSIGGHPIAGKEISGIDAADAALFRDAAYAVVDSDHTDRATVDTLAGLVEDIGARPVRIDAAGHDAMLARTSHLAQAVSSALSLYLDGARDDPLKGPGIQGMLRLARGDEKLWAEIFSRNSDNVSETIGGFMGALENLRDRISQMDADGVESLMRQSREALT